jgi:hypothetical protein
MHRLIVLSLLGCGATPTAPKAPVPNTSVKAPVTPTENPCFANKPAIVAAEMWKTLEKYSWSVYLSEEEQAPPPTTFGSCKVERNKVTSNGTLVAELGCGVRVLSRGILDDLGLQIGARGQDVLDRKPKPVPGLACMANGPDQVRCHFDRAEDSDLDASWYVVSGKLGKDDDALTGNAAREFFASRTLIELDVSIWCH